MSAIDIAAYPEQLAAKCDRVEAMLSAFAPPAAQRVPSPPQGFRLRAEFRIWHDGDDLYYAMFDGQDPKTPLRIDEFPIASERIQAAMPRLRELLLPSEALRRKLFQVEFLSTLSGELLLTLIYHRPLSADWEAAAGELEHALGAHVIGRSRKQKLVLSRDWVEERLPLNAGEYHYRQYEQGFTQPNGRVNCEMINWACAQAQGLGGDLLELYCGNGNFTLPLATQFDEVLATELSKRSIEAALHNQASNGVDNLALARLSAEEMSAALRGDREFRRLKNLPRSLADYRFSTLFVDPPRAGLDPATLTLAAGFDNVLYVSCNPLTLAENLRPLTVSHQVEALALFDQFPYTDHMECGVRLARR